MNVETELDVYSALYDSFYESYEPCSDSYLCKQWKTLKYDADNIVCVAQTDVLNDLMSGRRLE